METVSADTKERLGKKHEAGMDEEVIRIEGLKKSFPGIKVLDGFNMTLYKGENLAVLGKSGSGKSVLIKCIVSLIRPDEGSVNVLGEDVLSLEDEALNILRKKVGFVFQSAALFDSMTVRENLEFPLRDMHDLDDDKRQALVEEVLNNVGLIDAIDKMPSELSGGMKKRVGLARTLILKPEIILYDEPTTGLDPVMSREISHLVLDMQEKYNTSSVIITHDISCARITAERIIILKEGKAAAEGTFDELANSGEEWIKSFFES